VTHIWPRLAHKVRAFLIVENAIFILETVFTQLEYFLFYKQIPECYNRLAEKMGKGELQTYELKN
jgi:hypothetical protein